MKRVYRSLVTAALCMGGCGDEQTGDVRLLLSAEASITDGVSAGSASEDIRDGWDVRFQRYVVVVGDVRLSRTAGGESVEEPGLWIADLVRIGEAGRELSVLSGLRAGQWDKLSYATPRASADAEVLGDVPEAIVAEMIDQGWTYYIEATLESQDEQLRLAFGVDAPARFEDCELDGQPGVSVSAGTTQTATLTFHGDHLFFNALPTGAEGNVVRRAGWIAQADADGDSVVTADELRSLRAVEVFTRAEGYSLDGFEGPRIETALDFARAQLVTQGHYQGEGECTWRYDPEGGGR